jgi:hypothetical protein
MKKQGPDLFDLFSAPPAIPTPAPPIEADTPLVHWIFVTTTRARTGCGIYASSYDRSTRLARTETGDTFQCSLDAYSDTVTCRACKEAI